MSSNVPEAPEAPLTDLRAIQEVFERLGLSPNHQAPPLTGAGTQGQQFVQQSHYDVQLGSTTAGILIR